MATTNITCTRSAIGELLEVTCEGLLFTMPEGHMFIPGSSKFILYVFICLILVLLSGLFSGLTLGMLSLDPTAIHVLSVGGKPHEQKNAKRIAPIVARHHLLLVTLLLCNATVMESLPLVLSRLVTELPAILISVTAVLMFGEVIPQAICSRHGLAIGARLSYVVGALMLLLLPIAWPIAKMLDLMLGHNHSAYFRRAELAVLMDVHHHHDSAENEDPLTEGETNILKGCLSMREKSIGAIMTPISNVFMLPVTTQLTEAAMKEIFLKGHSRVPIFTYNRLDASQFLLVKSIIQVKPSERKSMRDAGLHNMLRLNAKTPAMDVLDIFQTGSHIAGVVNDDEELIGLISLEDVIEEILQEEIWDEKDLPSYITRHALASRLPHHSSSGRLLQLASAPRQSHQQVEAPQPPAEQLRSLTTCVVSRTLTTGLDIDL